MYTFEKKKKKKKKKKKTCRHFTKGDKICYQ